LKIVNIYRFSLLSTDLDAKIITVEVLEAILLEKTVCPAEYFELCVVLVDTGFAKRFHGETRPAFQLILAVFRA
jgi:hypothetical protein